MLDPLRRSSTPFRCDAQRPLFRCGKVSTSGYGQLMKRREFISFLGSAVAAWPLVARAQQPPGKMRRLGVLQPGVPPDPLVEAMKGRLRELGYSEGRDIAFEFRWAEGKLERLTQLATELADLKVDVITALSTPAAIAAQKATTTIPTVFSAVGDPVGTGLVSNCPSGRKCDRLVSAGYGVGREAARNP